MVQRQATFMVCDNPDCKMEEEIHENEPIPGFIIRKGSWADASGGGPIPVTYACSERCLTDAVSARITEEG